MAAATLSKTLRLHRPRFPIPNPAPRSNLSSSPISPAPPPPPPPPPPPAASASSATPSQGKERGRWSKLLLFLPGAITFGLGTWQIFRRQEKIEMLEYRKKRLEMEPIPWNRAAPVDQNVDELEFRKVVCEGIFDEEKSVYLGPRSRSISGVTENGYYVITPLIPTTREPGSVQLPVLVNRGWVPRAWHNKALEDQQNIDSSSKLKADNTHQDGRRIWWKFWSKNPTVSQAKESSIVPVKVIGVIRGSENPSIFVPANDPSRCQWFYVDVPMIARACGLPENTVYIEEINGDTSATNPYPVPKDVNTLISYSVMPQDHLNYTITWYSLSAAVTYMAFKRTRPKKSLR